MKTKEQVKQRYNEMKVWYILNNYIHNEDKCVEVTGHSLASIRAMFRNIAYDYTGKGLKNGNPMYTRMADKYREENKVWGKPMTKKSFCVRFGIIK